MIRQNYLCDKVGFKFLDFCMSKFLCPTFCGQYRTVPWVLCKIQLIQYERVNRKSLGSSLHFNEATLNSFDMSNNEESHLLKEMHEIHRGSCFRLNDDPGITLSSVGQCLMLDFGWAHRGSTGVFFL